MTDEGAGLILARDQQSAVNVVLFRRHPRFFLPRPLAQKFLIFRTVPSERLELEKEAYGLMVEPIRAEDG